MESHAGYTSEMSFKRKGKIKAYQNNKNNLIVHLVIYLFTHLYRVFTKEWCSYKNLLNDYILQMDGAPPIFTGMYESYSILFSNSARSDVLQMETTTNT
jgi:hypothetical protein